MHSCTITNPVIADTPPRVSRRALEQSLGAICLAHLAGLTLLKHQLGTPGELLWISHVSLALVGVALVLSLPLLSKIAFTLIAIPHMLWIADAASGVLLGVHPLGMVEYLSHVGYVEILATSHHLYLLPLLLLIHPRFRALDRRSLVCACVCYAYLVLISRIATVPHLNVNWVFRPFPAFSSEWFRSVDSLHPSLLLTAIVCVVVLVGMIPTTLLSLWAQRRSQST